MGAASSTVEGLLLLVASVSIGLAVAFVVWVFTSAFTMPRNDLHRSHSERERLEELRLRSATFRWFEPLVLETAENAERNSPVTYRLPT